MLVLQLSFGAWRIVFTIQRGTCFLSPKDNLNLSDIPLPSLGKWGIVDSISLIHIINNLTACNDHIDENSENNDFFHQVIDEITKILSFIELIQALMFSMLVIH